MRLPVLKSCCWCASLTQGAYIIGLVTIMLSVVCIAVSSAELPHHRSRAPEDNLIALMTLMSATLAFIFNLVLIVGIYKSRPPYLQVAMLFNALLAGFSCVLLLVKCAFSPEYSKTCFSLAQLLLGSVLLTATTIFCIYYFLIINSLHINMKLQNSQSPVPV